MSGCDKRKRQSGAVLEQPNANSAKMQSKAAETAAKQSSNATKKPEMVKQHIMYKFSVVWRAKAPGYKFASDRTNTKADALKEAIHNCNLIENEGYSIEDNVIKSDEIDTLLKELKGGSTEWAIPAIEELRKDLPNIVYDRSVSLFATPSSEPRPKRRRIMNTKQQSSAADTDSDDSSIKTNAINNANVNKDTLTSRNGISIDHSDNASNYSRNESNSIASMSNYIESNSCSISSISNFNGSSINCGNNQDNNVSNSDSNSIHSILSSTMSNCNHSCHNNCNYNEQYNYNDNNLSTHPLYIAIGDSAMCVPNDCGFGTLGLLANSITQWMDKRLERTV